MTYDIVGGKNPDGAAAAVSPGARPGDFKGLDAIMMLVSRSAAGRVPNRLDPDSMIMAHIRSLL